MNRRTVLFVFVLLLLASSLGALLAGVGNNPGGGAARLVLIDEEGTIPEDASLGPHDGEPTENTDEILLVSQIITEASKAVVRVQGRSNEAVEALKEPWDR